ncbi:PA14 domain-containing protein [Marininema mesophilum]|uniref:PA14 domain-containing protein n=1 Tax=Marininema mesophilum TaxID=1048340 RepID=A0A1H2UM83_9BACL|nr:neuraminidase-like domain-containing protein [Marininema mesophilum]SDW57191.1 PA14 domain-containing protein [Marininema mesophilum]
MNRIIYPLTLQMQGKGVSDLQEGLQLLLEKDLFQFGWDERQEFRERLGAEQAKDMYGECTYKLVGLFQEQHQLQASGEVDEWTSEVFNNILEELGAFSSATSEQTFLVSGQVLRENGHPVYGGLVRAFHMDKRCILRLGEDTTDTQGRYTIRYTTLPEVNVIHLRVVVLDNAGQILGETEVSREVHSIEIVDLLIPSQDVVTFHVDGKVTSRVSSGIGGLTVRIMDKGVGADVQLAETMTDVYGAYQITFTDAGFRQRGKEKPDLQACVFKDNIFLAGSDVHYNASNRETLHILLDEKNDTALQSEHETLTNALSIQFKGKLSELKETDERQDITYLANKTGWDARAVALSSLADQFSDRANDVGIEMVPPLFYALFRAGLPANEVLYQTDAKTVESIWKQAIVQGVIPSGLMSNLSQATEQFQKLTALRILESPAWVGVSPYKELVSVSLGDDLSRQRQFAELHTRYREDLPKFWGEVQKVFGEAVEKRLKVDGQLAFLTLNNAPLIRKLHEVAGQMGITHPLNLVEKGFYRADKWQKLMGNDSVPPEIPGENDDQKRNRYAELLAAHVRLSFPTAVIAQMVKSGETPLADDQLKSQVHTFLTEHQGNFEIGMHSVEQYIAHHKLQIEPEVSKEITQIQRVYQITPSDDAMNLLLKKGVNSAYAVIQYDRDEFIQTFKMEVGGEANARLIHTKAEQVHSTVLNIAVSYLSARNAPGIGVHSPAQIVDPVPTGPNPHASDVIAYSTLENLFDEMDYCTCEHCRSILSPAAYLVDLLLFIDRPVNPPGTVNPQTVLFERRPDIQHLPLTCENTTKSLPYIDLVNETLEYYVTNHLSLANYTGHNTNDDATMEELLANPQFISDKAYEILAGKPALVGDPMPLLAPASSLPFHQPLENLRRYFDRFEVPLPAVMETLRKGDNLERANSNEYGWRDIWMEELHFSRAEYARLTDRTLTVQQLYGYRPVTTEAEILSSLSNVKAFTHRLGISYEDIIEILKTCFINLNSILIPKLDKLGVPLTTIKAFKEGTISDAEFTAALAPHLDPSQYGGDIHAWVKNEANYTKIMSLITLANPVASDELCSFDKLEFRYANPDNSTNKIRAFEFIRLIRFIQLWKKLGWTIEETDKAITALYPKSQIPDHSDDAVNLQRLDNGFLSLLPRMGLMKRLIGALNLKQKKDLLPFLACFAPIDTHGTRSLYRQMFLNPSLLKQDGVFADNGYGHFLIGTEKLLTHTAVLRAAFQLTDEEFVHITSALGYDADTLLNLDNISAIYRRGWLARKLKLSIRELLLVIKFTGFDPFVELDPVNPSFLRLFKFLNYLRNLSLKPVQALYLIFNQDIHSRIAPDDHEILDFARSLRSDLDSIERDFAIVDDPDGQVARARMSLIYGNETTDVFFGLLSNQVVTDVEYAHSQATLQQVILNVAPKSLTYDHLRKRLAYSMGVMPDIVRDALKGVAGVTETFKNAVDELHKKTRNFFNRYPELWPHYTTYLTSSDSAEKKRADLLANLLPELKRSRKRQHGLQAISARVKSDLGFAKAILDDLSVLHAVEDHTRPAIHDLTAIEAAGLSAQFFFRDTAVGVVDLTSDFEANLAYTATGSHQLPAHSNPALAISGIWSGYLEAPENGFYNIGIEADSDTTVTLTLDNAMISLVCSGDVWSNNVPIELRAGRLYAISLKVEKVRGTLNVRWETSGRGWEIIPARCLYSGTLIDHLRHTYVRFLKGCLLAAELKLTMAETTFLTSHADYQINGKGWLNSLQVKGSPDDVTSTALLKAFIAMIDFASIKADLAPDNECLLAIIKNPAEATQKPDSQLFTLARWEWTSLSAILGRFGKVVGDLAHLDTFRQVYDAYSWVKKMGISATGLLKVVTNEPDVTMVRELQTDLRARYDESGWLNVLKPINDEMRDLQRNALVTYILHQMCETPATAHIDTAEKLFEYFLIDVKMEPCMQTSRVRHALSSVQLFIERCLINLERRVSPSSIRASHWQWMNRYRIWEANRKVFLYPENWLEPELRDDQSPFFKETMSELLQSDITEERASVALLNYLSKLEEVAKLEPCGFHYVENDPSKVQDDIAHVVARTVGANRKYFYRRCEYGYWTPWEHIKQDIEDNPVIPVVWKERLFLFWLKLIKETPLQMQSLPSGKLADMEMSNIIHTDTAKITVSAILCWNEFFNGKWQPTKTSDIHKPTQLGRFDPDSGGDNPFDRSALRLSVSEVGGALRVHISGQGSSSFTLYNTHSLPVRKEELNDFSGFILLGPSRHLDTSSDSLRITYNKGILLPYPGDTCSDSILLRPVLKNQLYDRVIVPHHLLQSPWDAPFFYEDNCHVFYVNTTERIIKIPDWSHFAPMKVPQKPDLIMPSLVLPELQLKPRPEIVDPYAPIHKGTGFGVVDRSPIERFVAENNYIFRGIGTLGTVRFGDKEIGPAGLQKNLLQGR